MSKIKLLLLITIFIYSGTEAQVAKDRITKILALSSKAQHIQLITNSNYKIDTLVDANCAKGELEAINHKGAIWLMMNGTSKVYKVDTGGLVKRIDNTCYQGFNFGATNISQNDTLYSLGGYGFWQITGSVRFFNETTGEWDIIRGIKDVPFAAGINALTYYDKQSIKLFIIYIPTKPEYVIPNEKQADKIFLQCFDFKTKKWWEDPKTINPKIASKLSDLIFVQKLGSGVLLNSSVNGKTLLLNFNKNKVGEVDEKYNTELLQLKNSRTDYITYTINDTINIYDLKKETTISSFIKPTQIKPYNEPIYLESISNDKIKEFPWLIYSIIINGILALVMLLLLVQRNQTRKVIKVSNENIIDDSPEKEGRKIKDYVNNLTLIEKEVIKLLVKNSQVGVNTSVTQLNKILGTEKKSDKIQNNIRGEILTIVNQKFMSFASVNNNLIERQRSTFDKRNIEYFINHKYVKKFTLKMFEGS